MTNNANEKNQRQNTKKCNKDIKITTQTNRKISITIQRCEN